MTFKDWADGCEFRLQGLAREIEAAGNSVRQIRTNAVKFDRANTARNRSTLPEMTAALLELLETTKDSSAWSMLDNAFMSQLDGIEMHVREMLQGTADGVATDAAEEPTRPRRKPPLLQKGARHFSSLAGIFQLQDCFDQRVDHISTGTALASGSTAESQVLMLQVINAQVSGIATMTSEYTEQAIDAANSLKSMHEASMQDTILGDSVSEEDATRVVERVIEPVNAMISTLRSRYLGPESEDNPGDSGPAEEAAGGGEQLDSIAKAEISASLKQFEECIDVINEQHPRVANHALNRTVSQVSKTYDDLNMCIASLKDSADDLIEFTDDLVASEQESSQFGPDASGLLESLVNSFTMDSEREDHRSALHRLGLES